MKLSIKGFHTGNPTIQNSLFQKTICNSTDKHTENISDTKVNPYRILLCILRGSLYIITRKSDSCLFPCFLFLDYDVEDKIYDPYDNLGLSVILHGDGTREYKVVGAFAEAVKAQSSNVAQWKRLKEIFTSKSLQMVSFTITEKGYALQKADGTWFPFVEADIKNGPDKACGAMAVLVAMLYERYKAGRYPIALVSMDNCSQNGAKLRESVLTMTEEWKKAGFVDICLYKREPCSVSFLQCISFLCNCKGNHLQDLLMRDL